MTKVLQENVKSTKKFHWSGSLRRRSDAVVWCPNTPVMLHVQVLHTCSLNAHTTNTPIVWLPTCYQSGFAPGVPTYYFNSTNGPLVNYEGIWGVEKWKIHMTRLHLTYLGHTSCGWIFSFYRLTECSTTLMFSVSQLHVLYRFSHFSPVDSLFSPIGQLWLTL